MPKSDSSRDSNLDDSADFGDILKELDREESRIVIRLEIRKFRKPVTVIEGLSKSKSELEEITRKLKQGLATGGTAKEGLILLQGDHREKAREDLVKFGYSASSIEVQ